MKIRNGYVSNSSSSSFLIIFKNIFEFCDFHTFSHYKMFEDDLRNATEESGVNHLESLIFQSYYEKYDSVFDYFDIVNDFRDTAQFQIENLFKIAQLSDEEYKNTLKKVENITREIRNKVDKKYPYILDVFDNARNPYMFLNQEEIDFVSQCKKELSEKFYEENFYNELKKDAKQIATDLKNGLKNQGYEVKSIRYEDHTEDGYFMEKGFMPFLESNPEKNYEIITTCEH